MVCVDLCGPMSVLSSGQRRYSFSAADIRSCSMRHDALPSKDDATYSFHRMLIAICSMGYTVRRLRVNNDTVL
jgi:hypothetical protein